MFIYQITSYYYNEKMCDNVYGSSYLLHEKEFSKDKFNELCSVALKNIQDKNTYDVCKYLIENCGFQWLHPTCSYEYDEDEV